MTVVQDNIAGRDDTDDGERNLTRLGDLEGSRECVGNLLRKGARC
jgi:hypothetical protein